MCVAVRFLISATLFFGHNSRAIRTLMTIVSSMFALYTLYKILKNFYLMEGDFFTRLTRANNIETGVFQGKVWWHPLRYIHLVSWSLVAIFLNVHGLQKWAWSIVAADVVPGLIYKTQYLIAKPDGISESVRVPELQDRKTIFKF